MDGKHCLTSPPTDPLESIIANESGINLRNLCNCGKPGITPVMTDEEDDDRDDTASEERQTMQTFKAVTH